MYIVIVMLLSGFALLICNKLRRRRNVVLKQHYKKFLQQVERHSFPATEGQYYRSLSKDMMEEGRQAE